MKHLKTVGLYAILLTAIGLVTLVSSEIALRVSGHVPVASVHTVSQADYDRIPGMFEPFQDVTEKPHPRLHYHVSINSLGYRGREIDREKPAGVVRILCLGDSGTFGQFVNDPDTLSSVLEENLRREGFPVEVINGGVPGTTIVDQMEFLRRGIVLKPDIVILTFSENDITDLAAEVPQYLALERNRQLKSQPGLKPFYDVVRDTALFNYFLTVRATWAARSIPAAQAAPAQPSPLLERESHESWWIRYSDQLEAMRQYLNDRKVRLLFNAFPTHQRIGPAAEMDRDLSSQLERVELLARRKGIQTIEILPAFLQSGFTKEDLYLLPYDGHANMNGYRLQAAALLPALREAVVAVIQRPLDAGPDHSAMELASYAPLVR